MYNFSQGDMSWTMSNSIIEIADYQVAREDRVTA
jgi:hypothetical protein